MENKIQGQKFASHPCPLKHIFNRNDKSEHITHLDNVVRIIISCLLLPKKMRMPFRVRLNPNRNPAQWVWFGEEEQ